EVCGNVAADRGGNGQFTLPVLLLVELAWTCSCGWWLLASTLTTRMAWRCSGPACSIATSSGRPAARPPTSPATATNCSRARAWSAHLDTAMKGDAERCTIDMNRHS